MSQSTLDTVIESHRQLIVQVLTLRLGMSEEVTDQEVAEAFRDMKVVLHDFTLEGIEDNRSRLMAIRRHFLGKRTSRAEKFVRLFIDKNIF